MRRTVILLTTSLLASFGAMATAPPASAADTTYRLWAGQTLEEGERLTSPTEAFTLEMRADGDLVEYDADGDVVWSSGTSVRGSVLQMQEDGNAVIYSPGHTAVWETGTTDSGAQTVEVQDDGNLVLYAAGHLAVWSTDVIVGPADPANEPVSTLSTSEGGARGGDNTSVNGRAPSPDGHESYIRCTVWGTDGDDTLVGTIGNDVICGQTGDDVIRGGGGFDKIYGGDGDDELSGNNTIQTLDGADLVASGEPIGDQIWGDDGVDTVVAGDGDDEIEAGPGSDIVDAGDGDDRIAGDRFFAKAGDPDGDDDIRTGFGNDFVNAGGGDDVVIDAGNTVADSIRGGAGSDAIVGLTGWSSNFNGGPGNDLLYPAAARLNPLGNSVTGGDGNDIAILLNRQMDSFTRGAEMETFSIPVQQCQITYPIASDNYDDVNEFKVGCPVLGPIDLEINGNGKPSLGSDLFSEDTSLNPADWRELVLDRTGRIQGDLCVCDQILGVPVLQQDRVY